MIKNILFILASVFLAYQIKQAIDDKTLLEHESFYLAVTSNILVILYSLLD